MSGLKVDSLAKNYLTSGQPLEVLRDATFSLAPEKTPRFWVPSGSGKSTLLQIVGTLDRPTAGDLSLGGQNPFELDDKRLADFRNLHIGFVFQDHHLLPQLSVLENVLLPTIASGRADEPTVRRAHELLDQVGLIERLEHRPAELSGGERQRVGVARALIRQPKLLLADEPTGNLDRTNAMAIGALLADLQHQEHTMLIVVTHSQELAALFQRRFELIDGVLTEPGCPTNL